MHLSHTWTWTILKIHKTQNKTFQINSNPEKHEVSPVELPFSAASASSASSHCIVPLRVRRVRRHVKATLGDIEVPGGRCTWQFFAWPVWHIMAPRFCSIMMVSLLMFILMFIPSIDGECFFRIARCPHESWHIMVYQDDESHEDSWSQLASPPLARRMWHRQGMYLRSSNAAGIPRGTPRSLGTPKLSNMRVVLRNYQDDWK